MKTIWNNFKVAFAMYSKIPMPPADWEKENMKYALCFFPWVGLAVGAVSAVLFWLLQQIGAGSMLRAAVLTAVPVLVTGGIHLDGYLDTMDALTKEGIAYSGAGRNLAEASAVQYFVAGGRKIAFVSATEIERFYHYTKKAGEKTPGVLKTQQKKAVLSAITEARANSDYVIMFVHWGAEGKIKQDSDQRALAQEYAAAGVDAIIGSHPHRLQGVEFVDDVPVVCMQGRVHYYEGYSMTDVVLPTRLMKLMGAKALFLTNAAGGIKQGTKPGSLMLLNGQIACFVPSPLIGPNIDELGTRFPDMSQIYDLEFQKIARKAAASLDIDLMEGVYLQLTGPQYESPQEIAMCRTLGADAVGMSTACEAIAARHMGMRVIGISCITNLAAGISPQPLCHAEVQEAADMVAPQFKKLVAATIQGIAKTL